MDETSTDRVGTAFGDCVVHRRIEHPTTGLYKCTYVFRLTEGDIVVQGLDRRGPSVSAFIVLGGTGTFADAVGEATLTDSGSDTDGQTDIGISLID